MITPKGSRSWMAWLLISGLVVLVDQLSKYWVQGHFSLGESREITGFFNLVLVYNTGAAFSFLAAEAGWQRLLFTGIAVVASVVIIFMLRRYPDNRVLSLALALILGGAIGNLVDRLLLGHVVDFLDFHLGGYHWPAFNGADSAITLGAVLLVWDSLRKPAVKR